MLWPPPPADPETFAALRARREAHQAVTRRLHPPLDPYQFYCRACGHPLDSRDLDDDERIRCEACGVATPLPPRPATEIRRRRRRQFGAPPRSFMHDVAVVVYLLVAVILVFAAL